MDNTANRMLSYQAGFKDGKHNKSPSWPSDDAYMMGYARGQELVLPGYREVDEVDHEELEAASDILMRFLSQR